MVIHASDQKKECCRDDTRALTHDSSRRQVNTNFSNCLIKNWIMPRLSPGVYVTQYIYIYFQMKISFKFVE